MEVTPLPPEEDLESVVMDIIEHREIAFLDGQVRRWQENPEKKIKSDLVLKDVISRLEKKKFKVAVLINKDKELLMGQPIAIAIDPMISYLNFPDHPHLNVPGMIKGQCFPDSLCYGYTVEPERYAGTDYAKHIRALDEITLWLFRHQIWEMYRKITGKGKWIGNHYKHGLPAESYPNFLNPLGLCRCGRQTSYLKCHLTSDLRSQVQLKSKSDGHEISTQNQNAIINSMLMNWGPRVQAPIKEQFAKLTRLQKRVSKGI